MRLLLLACVIAVVHGASSDPNTPTGRRLLAEKNAEKARRVMPASEPKCVEKAVMDPGGHRVVHNSLTPSRPRWQGYPPRGGWTLAGCVCVLPNKRCTDYEVDTPANGEVPSTTACLESLAVVAALWTIVAKADPSSCCSQSPNAPTEPVRGVCAPSLATMISRSRAVGQTGALVYATVARTVPGPRPRPSVRLSCQGRPMG